MRDYYSYPVTRFTPDFEITFVNDANCRYFAPPVLCLERQTPVTEAGG